MKKEPLFKHTISAKLNDEPHRNQRISQKKKTVQPLCFSDQSLVGTVPPESSSSASTIRIAYRVGLSVRLPTNTVVSGNATQDELFTGLQLVSIVDETLSWLWPRGQLAGKETLPVAFLLLQWILGEVWTSDAAQPATIGPSSSLDTIKRRRGMEKTNIGRVSILSKAHGIFLSEVKSTVHHKKKRNTPPCEMLRPARGLSAQPIYCKIPRQPSGAQTK
jgi:hypothetical protein